LLGKKSYVVVVVVMHIAGLLGVHPWNFLGDVIEGTLIAAYV
jgi:hypothetical protein